MLLLLLTLATAYSVIVTCPSKCSSTLDCSLNGDCTTGTCSCDAGWTGPCCGQLDLAPINYTLTSGGYRNPATSTWGGNIILNSSTSTYHMWVAEMQPAHANGSGSCGLTTWSSNSQITHVSSSSVGGPYSREEVAVTAWSHNPIVRQMPDSTFVLYHIGSGGAPANSTPPKGYCALNGTSPCGEQSFDHCGAVPGDPCSATPAGFACHAGTCMGSGGNCGVSLAEPQLSCNDTYASCVPAAQSACAAQPGCTSFSLSPIWTSGLTHAKLFGAATPATTPNSHWALDPLPQCHHTPCGSNNPGPIVHPNGTIFVVFTDQHMGLWRADTWRGPYTLVTSGACGGGEDPSLFLTPRGHFHCLYHRSPFSNPNLAIGHAYSVDGFTWLTAADPAANSTIATVGHNGSITHGKRERPHVYYEGGRLRAFVSGVGLVPECNPLAPTYSPAADCSAEAQYPLIDSNSPSGWQDATYTSVQEMN